MKYRQLGKEKLKVSAIGLGYHPLTDLDGAKDEARVNQVIHRALDLGITFLDTADTYAMGLNEELLGKAIKGKRNQVVLADKFGITKNIPARGKCGGGTPHERAVGRPQHLITLDGRAWNNQVISNTGFEIPCSTKGESCRFSPLETP